MCDVLYITFGPPILWRGRHGTVSRNRQRQPNARAPLPPPSTTRIRSTSLRPASTKRKLDGSIVCVVARQRWHDSGGATGACEGAGKEGPHTVDGGSGKPERMLLAPYGLLLPTARTRAPRRLPPYWLECDGSMRWLDCGSSTGVARQRWHDSGGTTEVARQRWHNSGGTTAVAR